MPYELPERAEQFGVRQLLHRALSCAKLPPATAMIGPATRAAIAAVAEHHPDATVEHIVAVYDAHALEQRELPIAERHAALGDPRGARALDFAATDTLITQLTITYPSISRAVITEIVEELQTALGDLHLHGLDLLRIEYEAHQRLARAQ
ncbi:hypothetical protein Y900_026385 [Mycolicibacterium aromaticivorans JS19b1 = JCM 16368]|uniref:Uncharacterized protein n=1 Tax=Mycolicibacterium aromaticivorans JS19b1 = JCM 16368 TaxID=1440774 RepID=A0A064CU98_9MYCO|nr:hypothetical protein [Mycolicibacterium aromaticivorans]KDF02368.1 hypothetical protein Y900_026385 [Mycolicibacterium aromaticivorans JS19b1 = JCM 16368]